MPGTRICAPEEHSVFQHEEAENLTDGLMPNGKHQEADELHRQHDGEREDRDRSREVEGRPDAVGNRERENHSEGADDQARACLQDDVDFAADLRAGE